MFKKIIFFLFVLLLVKYDVFSTHIRAGEIIAKRISTTSLTYEFTIIGYTDTGSEVEFGGGTFYFGDGNVLEVLDEGALTSQKILLENQVALNLFTIVHTFQAPGRYVVSYYEQNRNNGILNMENSVDTPFFIETEILIDPFFGQNNTPILLIPPIDNGIMGIRYIHNPGAYDPDGDSLSYEIVIPMQEKEYEVTNYRFPNAEEFYTDYAQGNESGLGPPTFTLDSIVGDLVWDAPGAEGEYNFAFRVIEWRKVADTWYKLGHVTRDMQVFIKDATNERPILEAMDPICVDAGTLIIDTIVGYDPDNNDVKIQAFGGPFEFISSPASYNPNPALFTKSPTQLFFEWQTNCNHVRQRPYDVQFKISDKPNYGPNLVEFMTWQIQIVPPAPDGLLVDILPGRNALLNWDLYSCENASIIQVWRRIGSYEFIPDNCEVGMPAGSGYQLIGEVDGNTISYIDSNDGKGLAPGSKYCYRLLAEFPLPEGGISYVSEEVCVILEADAPIINNVSIENTTIENGDIQVNWFPPLTLDPVIYPKPYKYKIRRYDGFIGKENEFEYQIMTLDTFFIDQLVNTLNNIYNYEIEVFDSEENTIDFSAQASSVRLELQGKQLSIDLSWNFDVPWSNSTIDFPMHYVYRNNVSGNASEEFILIDSVNVIQNGFNYTDNGSFEGIELDENLFYCYYVVTSGSYENDSLPKSLENGYQIFNKSQKICAQTNDLVPPCPPVDFKISDQFICENYFIDKSCELKDFENRIEWELDDSECSLDSKIYNVYFSDNGIDNFEIIASISENYYLHKNLTNLKGSYFITALDRSGNESIPSDTVHRDNCPYYLLPNVFTPNEDGKNDFFTPFYSDGSIPNFDYNKCPRFVKSVIFNVFDRTGVKLFSYNSLEDVENGIYINWDGKDFDGKDLASGTYYYTADIIYDILDKENDQKQIKGWVQVLK